MPLAKDVLILILINEYIKKEGDKFVVYSHLTNKKFGSYDTRKEAMDRLKQMARFRKE